jgi:hypothetical protein
VCYFKCRVPVRGPGPGPRYGHVMALVGQRFLLCIGGNDGMYVSIYILSYLVLSVNLSNQT